MSRTGLNGPYRLDNATIEKTFPKVDSGTYVLGHINNEGLFIVEYVGRSDNDLNDRLKSWIGEYSHFKASYFERTRDAFDKECTIYHDFGNLDNKVHPASPEGVSWKCPICHA